MLFAREGKYFLSFAVHGDAAVQVVCVSCVCEAVSMCACM